MSAIPKSMRRLQWKLTFSYTLVTIAALGLIFIALVTVVTWYLYSGTREGSAMVASLRQLSPEALPALSRTPPDGAALQAWIADIQRANPQESQTANSLLSDPSNELVVLDTQGRVLAASSAKKYPPGEIFFNQAGAPSAEVLRNALGGSSEITTLTARENNDYLVAAAPVLNGTGQVEGGLFLRMRGPNVLRLMLQLLRTSLPFIAVIALGVMLMGTVFGAWTARSLTARLRNLAVHASRWGQGDFSDRIVESSPDEIGELAGELNRIAGELQDLIRERQQLAASSERNRLARDLHDSVKQQVFAISMNLAASQTLWHTNPAEARKRLDQAAALSRNAQAELVSLIRAQPPTHADAARLEEKLRELATQWEKQAAIPIECEISAGLEFPSETSEALYRIAQEALANVARHGRAAHARLCLKVVRDSLRLSVEDDGCGFDPAGAYPGMGLKFMRERVQALGGRFEISSQEGRTSLQVCLPYPSTPVSGENPLQEVV